MRAIVTGMIGTFPVGGVAWDYGQYLLGLEQLGFDVYYLEDVGVPTYDPIQQTYGDDCSYALRFLHDSLAALSPRLAERWHFRDENGQTYGMEPAKLHALLADADLLLNVSGATLLRDEYLICPNKVLIDTDPAWNHFVIFPRWDKQGGWDGVNTYRAHDYFFTYAERFGRPDCLLPDLGLTWHLTRPPVVLDRWQPRGPGGAWTTVMTWNNFRKPVEYQGRKFGSKEMEFHKIEHLPHLHSQTPLEVAVGGVAPPVELWREMGWRVIDSHSVSLTLDDYQNYIQTSLGELSVAKNIYVATRTGWFSCRSTCYLAAGRPVVAQDTGFSEIVPTGEGLFAFNDGQEAADALATVEADYSRHQRAAREVAAEFFDAPRVLNSMLQQIGVL